MRRRLQVPLELFAWTFLAVLVHAALTIYIPPVRAISTSVSHSVLRIAEKIMVENYLYVGDGNPKGYPLGSIHAVGTGFTILMVFWPLVWFFVVSFIYFVRARRVRHESSNQALQPTAGRSDV
jgi:hypothetical protein